MTAAAELAVTRKEIKLKKGVIVPGDISEAPPYSQNNFPPSARKSQPLARSPPSPLGNPESPKTK